MYCGYYDREKDLDEVLQASTIYTNVSKGSLASQADLVTAFGTDDVSAIARLILDEGELQVSEKERQSSLEAKFKDICLF